MKILQTVVVKQVLTEKSKHELLDKYQDKLLKLEKECEQLKFEQKKLEKNNKELKERINEHFRKEFQSRQDTMKSLTYKLEQLQLLPLGSELMEKEIQAIKEIRIGDCWGDTSTSEIIIKDGIIQEIR